MEKRYRRIGLAALCWCAAAAVAAQSFRRVRSVDELEEGARYVLAGYCESTPDSVFVMCSQEATGLKEKNRASRKMKPDGEGRLHVTDGGTAIFELVRENASTYRLKDVALDAWLAYSTEKTSSSSTALYTLEDGEFEKYESSERLARTFKLQEEGKGFFLTKENVEVAGSGREKAFILLVDDYAPHDFKLYRSDAGYGDSLYIYKEVEPPALERVAGTDWTFRGDWTGDSLYALDYTAARRIDFTEISLPQAQGLADGGRLPEDDVWTYVRQGEAGRLPEGWPNVVEVGRTDGEVQGEAVTPIRGGDSCVWGAKYTFEVPEGTGISWYRTVGADGGWYTAGLPFAVQAVTRDVAGGEPLAVRRMAFEGFAGTGAVFRRMEEDEPWEAGIPVLWSPETPCEGTVCFHASGATVMAADTLPADAPDGFYAVSVRTETGAERQDGFQLDASGTRFVRLAPGSWVEAGRAVLKCSLESGASVRLLDSSATGIEDAPQEAEAVPVPVYRLDGRKQGELRGGEPLPAAWPPGIYVTPHGKVLHPRR